MILFKKKCRHPIQECYLIKKPVRKSSDDGHSWNVTYSFRCHVCHETIELRYSHLKRSVIGTLKKIAAQNELQKLKQQNELKKLNSDQNALQ